MVGLQVDRPIWLCCLLATAIYFVVATQPPRPLFNGFRGNFTNNNGQDRSGLNVVAKLIRTIMKLKEQINQGNFSGLPTELAKSLCLADDDAIKKFLDDVAKGGKSDVSDEKTDDDDDGKITDMMEDENDDLLEKVSDTTLKCLVSSIGNGTTSLCRRFAKGPGINSFKKLMSAGIKCIKHLKDSNMDDDDLDLDDAQQEIIMDELKKKNVEDWDDDDFDEAISGAPDQLDEILDDLPDGVFQKRIKKLGKLLKKGQGSPGLAIAIRQKLRKIKPNNQLTADDINNIGQGIRAFDVDDIDEIDDDAFEDSDLDFDDVDDDEPLGLAIGRKLRKRLNKPNTLNATSIKKIFKFIKSDPRYLNDLDSEALADALDDIGMEDLDDDEATLVCQKVRKSSNFDDASAITGPQLRKLGNALKGCGEDFFVDLTKEVVEASLDFLNDLDLGPSEARQIFKKLNLGQASNFNNHSIRRLGKVMKALNTDELDDIPDDAFVDSLDALDDIDFDDAAEKLIIHKIKKGSKGKLPVALLKNKILQDAFSLDDLDDVEDNDLLQELTQLGEIDWEPTLAAHLVQKLMKLMKKTKFAATDLESLGKLAVGIQTDDIDDLLDDKDEVFSTAAILGKHDDDLSDAQSEAMAAKIKKNLGNSDLTELDAIRVGQFIIYMDDDEIEKIRFTGNGGKAFVQAMSRASGNKLSLKKLAYLVKRSRQLLKVANNDNDDILSKEDVREMLGSLLGMSSEDIRGLAKDVLLKNLDLFSKLPLSKEQGEAIVEKVEEFDSEYKCKSDRLAQLGSNLQFLSEDKLKALCKPQLAAAASTIIKNMDDVNDKRDDRKKNGFGREVSDDSKERMKKVTQTIRDSLEDDQARRRRAVSSLTCDQIKLLAKQATQLPVQEFSNLGDVDFSNCLDTLGKLSNWSPEHLLALVAKAKKVLYGHATWNIETIKRVGSITAGLTVNEIKELALSSLDTMTSTGKHGLMSLEKLKAGFVRWLQLTKSGDVSTITGTELSSLSEYVCGVEASKIPQINVESFKQAIRTIGAAKSCSHEQLKAFAKRAISGYGGSVNTWAPTVISDLGRTIGGLEPAEVAQLQANQINVIKPEIISLLPTQTLGALSVDQYNYFSSNQANAVTNSQFQSLTPSKQKALQDKATVSFGVTDTNPPNGAEQRSPVTVVLFIVVSLLTVFIF